MLNNNFFNNYSASIQAKQNEIAELELVLQRMHKELGNALSVKQQWASVDAQAQDAVNLLANAIEYINFAYHNLGSKELGEAFIQEFDQNVIDVLGNLRNKPKADVQLEMLPEAEVEAEVEVEVEVVELETIPDEPRKLSASVAVDRMKILIEQAGMNPEEFDTILKTRFGSASPTACKALVELFENHGINPLKATRFHELNARRLLEYLEQTTGKESSEIRNIVRTETGLTGKVGYIVYILTNNI